MTLPVLVVTEVGFVVCMGAVGAWASELLVAEAEAARKERAMCENRARSELKVKADYSPTSA